QHQMRQPGERGPSTAERLAAALVYAKLQSQFNLEAERRRTIWRETSQPGNVGRWQWARGVGALVSVYVSLDRIERYVLAATRDRQTTLTPPNHKTVASCCGAIPKGARDEEEAPRSKTARDRVVVGAALVMRTGAGITI